MGYLRIKTFLLFIGWLVFYAIISVNGVSSQGLPVGNWRHHLPSNRVLAIAETPTEILGATEFGLVVWNKQDNSVEKINKVNGLSGFGITSLAYSAQYGVVVVGYSTGNIDILKNGHITNVVDISMASIIGSKKINKITIHGNRAFLACDFGVVNLDLENYLIRDSYFIGPFGSYVEVHEVAFSETHIYAATNAGMMVAPSNGVNLADFQNWQKVLISGQASEVVKGVARFGQNIVATAVGSDNRDYLYYTQGNQWQPVILGTSQYAYPEIYRIRESNGKLLVANAWLLDVLYFNTTSQSFEREEYVQVYSEGDDVKALDMLFDNTEKLWIADREAGLVRRLTSSGFEKIVLNGPRTHRSFDLAYGGGNMWVAPGAIRSDGNNTWNTDGVFVFENESWKTFYRSEHPIMQPLIDIFRISVDPGNPQKVYAAATSEGLLEFRNMQPLIVWGEENSPLQRINGLPGKPPIRLGGVAVDNNGNLWVTNSHSTNPIAVKKSNDQWLGFVSNGLISLNQMGKIVIDREGQKWALVPRQGLYVMKENNLDNASGFAERRLTTTPGSGGLPSSQVFGIAVDHDGYVWVGTDQGAVVYFSPSRVLTNQPVDATRIIVQEGNFAGYLLENETVNTIAVDGSNKKWFGTQRSGAFLQSSDGRRTVFHFTKENSPLPSNNILDIAINGQTGEVFFATDQGLVSFRGLATEATPVHTDVYAFPNPVKPDYTGYISIKGLVRNARVKITDITGNLVFETIAEGGQAVWDGKDLFGRRPSTGVYLVFSSNSDGTQAEATKIFFVN
jgi:streptogramin lyase